MKKIINFIIELINYDSEVIAICNTEIIYIKRK